MAAHVDTSNWTRENLAWVGGIFEGEGSICFYKRAAEGPLPALSIVSTDKDVLERYISILGTGCLNGPYKPKGLGKKLQWTVTISGHMRFQACVAAIWPWLGARRKAKAEEVLLASSKTPVATTLKAKQRLCKNGHVKTLANTYVNPSSGRKFCKDCSKAYMKNYYAANKENWHGSRDVR